MKAIGIIMVVLGHTRGISAIAKNIIFSFHMPLFFFISGFLFKSSYLQKKKVWFLTKYIRSLMIPYFVFGVLTYFTWLFILRHYGGDAGEAISPIRPVLGMLYGVGMSKWLPHNTPLWFLPCLFVIHVLFYGMARKTSGKLLALLVLSAVLTGHLLLWKLPFRLPWSFEIALIAQVFYGAGFFLRNSKHKDFRFGLSSWMACLVICLAVLAFSVKLNGQVDMNRAIFKNPLFFYSGAFSGIGICLLISKIFPYLGLISRIAREAIIIFSLHLLAISIITGFAVFILKLPLDFIYDYFLIALLYVLITFCMLLPTAAFIRRFFPWMVGRKRAVSPRIV